MIKFCLACQECFSFIITCSLLHFMVYFMIQLRTYTLSLASVIVWSPYRSSNPQNRNKNKKFMWPGRYTNRSSAHVSQPNFRAYIIYIQCCVHCDSDLNKAIISCVQRHIHANLNNGLCVFG